MSKTPENIVYKSRRNIIVTPPTLRRAYAESMFMLEVISTIQIEKKNFIQWSIVCLTTLIYFSFEKYI